MTIFSTERLIIRPWTTEDADDFFRIYGDPDVTVWLNAEPKSSPVECRDTIKILIERGETMDRYGYWAMELGETRRAIGSLILKRLPNVERFEIGWHLAQDCWGNGFATEAAQAGLAYGFTNWNLDCIEAITLPHNLRSRAVMERLGMTFQGFTNEFHNLELALYSIERSSLPRSRANP
ncbi:MAG: GNAT family N-acetyltransferase [Armatimonadetes bacterium]|nr:GNAT family N-acetyltransferase [Armatimonadota bacterium]